MVVVSSIDKDMVFVVFFQFFHVVFSDVFQSSVFSGGIGGIVGVASGSIPISFDWLGFVVKSNSVDLSESIQNVLGHQEVVTTFDSLGDSDLIFPLSWGDFGVHSGQFNSGIQAHSDVGFGQRSSEGVLISD